MPVINFGENDIYDVVIIKPGNLLYRCQQWILKKTGLFLSIPVGRPGLLRFLPKRMPMTTVGNETLIVNL